MQRRSFTKLVLAHALAGAASGMILAPVAARATEMDRTIAFYAHSSTDRGLRFLRTLQDPDGTWGGDIGNTARALRAFVTSYRQYTALDGPFMSKPIDWLHATLAARSDAELARLGTAEVSEAVITLRLLHGADGSDLVDRLQQVLAVRRPDVAGDGPVAVQFRIYLALTALAGDQSDAVNAFRRHAADVLADLQLPGGGFPGTDGSEAPAMTHASAVSLGLAGQGDGAAQERAALDRAIGTYSADVGAMRADEPAFLLFEAMQTAMTRAERVVRDGSMGQARTWRDTMTYALLELQAEDGGWLPGQSPDDRIAATARAVNAINKSLPVG